MRTISKTNLQKAEDLKEAGELTVSKLMKILEVSDSLARTYQDIINNNLFSDKASRSGTLAIGDLHEPFTLPEYLDFCVKIYNEFNLKNVVFLGDIIDNHYSSYHESDPDGHSAGAELLKAKNNIKRWYEAFPSAKVCIGNHDSIPFRKAMTSGLSSSWIKTIDEVLDTPNWDYSDYHIVDDVKYVHGIGRQAVQRATQDGISIVQGHYHAKSFANQFTVLGQQLFALQVGAGIDADSYAAAYGKHFQRPYNNVGIVKDGVPFLKFM